MAERVFAARFVVDPSGERQNLAVRVVDGVIAAVEPAAGPVDDIILMPALANAHDHARPVPTSSIGGFAKPLEVWLHRLQLYAPVDPYVAAAAPLARAARGGQAAVMVHYTKPQGPMGDLAGEAVHIARAATDVGVRIAFAVAMRNRNPLVYGDHDPVLDALDPEARAEIEARFLAPMVPVARQLEVVDEVAAAIASPMVDVQYGPNGVQWSTPEHLEAIADASRRTGRRVHMHLLETMYQRHYADTAYPDGMVQWLDRIGLLSERLTLAHCTYARPDELELLAARGVTISVNTASNLALRSGIAPVGAMLRAGCRVALGIDGQAFDEDDDALRDMRLFWSLHAGWGFDAVLPPAEALRFTAGHGRRSVGASGAGLIAVGEPADLLVIDRPALDADDLDAEGGIGLSALGMVFARATLRHVREVMVAGRTVVKGSVPTGVDLDRVHRTLREALRKGLPGRQRLRAGLPQLEAAIAGWYGGRAGCC